MRGSAHSLELCLALACACLATPTQAQSGPGAQSGAGALAVIVHPDNPVRDLTLTQLRAYFMLEYRKWDDGRTAVLYLCPPTSKEMQILRQQVYRMSATALNKYWDNQEWEGKITVRPTVIRTAAAAIRQIGKNAGGFTVVLAKDVPEAGVRVLKVDGKLPGEADYPLAGSEP